MNDVMCFHSPSQSKEAEVKSSNEKFVTRFSRVYRTCPEASPCGTVNLHRPAEQPVLIVTHPV